MRYIIGSVVALTIITPFCFKRSRRWLKWKFLSEYATGLIFPFLATAPPVLIAGAESANRWPKWLFDAVEDILTSKPWLRLVGLLWPVVLIPVSFGLERLREWLRQQDQLGQRELALLLKVLDRPVGKKLKRFARVSARVQRDGLPLGDGVEVFKEVTQPEEQLHLLVEAVHLFFQDELKVSNGDSLKVTLARMKGGRIDSFECFLPDGAGPKSTPADLQSKEASVNRAAEYKRLIIVPDIARELRRKRKARICAPGGSASSRTGSMICFPIIQQDPPEVPYVLTIKSSEPNHFTDAKKSRYEYIMQRFSDRIAMEHSLRKIKEANTK